ncbi:hypothetical protein CCZ01_07775 [Helicobacter monodelphidis]|uniref:HAMP domain-containing protein n=1 Tax=Helicobacter sp. 15-1451 TaxID=2004995 RepID=UPI000DCE2364|nr:HAMP domain-containing protein [Helicobacter sp. 15-1451]RAX56942.1 hypothetical protein CCZ01_07775 [Helicobacter sp. 15-1451]
MSIFWQILWVVILSSVTLLFISYKSEGITSERLRSMRLNETLRDIQPLYRSLIKGNIIKVKDGLIAEGYTIKTGGVIPAKSVILHQENGVFGEMTIWSRNTEYGILLRYLDDIILASRIDTEESDQTLINTLLIVQAILMFFLYAWLYMILRPIKQLTKSLKNFQDGNYQTRIQVHSKNELGELARSFNNMAETISELFKSKEMLLRNAGHELRTPITKGKLALEIMQDTPQKPIIQECFLRLDTLTNHLLTLEYLQGIQNLKQETFSMHTLLLESLSQSFADEESVKLNLQNDFQITGNLQWLSTALKNLIDNALKYQEADEAIEIILQDKTCSILNVGKPLQKEFTFYLNPFVQEEDFKEKKGYGLGLSLVATILKIHHFQLQYAYQHNKHIFSICFSSQPK